MFLSVLRVIGKQSSLTYTNLMKHLVSFLFAIFFIGYGFAQNAGITEKKIQLKTYPFSDPDPVPEFNKIYPYYRFNGYDGTGSLQDWNMVEMENDYIKLWVAPQIGGKIWGAVEKSTGKEFVYFNHVVKFRNVAMRGPWTSGGIEINFGVIGHAPTTSSPIDYFVRKNDDGSVSCFVGAIDLTSRTRWSVEVNLPKDKAYFTTRTTWDNPTGLEQSYYHWMNLGVKTAGNLEYIFPGNKYIGHDGENHAWPVDEKGREISWYEQNNFGGSKSYHVLGENSGFYGTYWHDDNFGFGHYSNYDEKPGKKIWIWGLSDQGMIWEKLLTDSDGQYTEIQSGRMFNQAAPQSSTTPFKNRGFASGATDEWTEYWFPVKGTKGLKDALPVGSVNLQQKEDSLNIRFCPNETVNGILTVKNGEKILFSHEIHSKPMQSISGSFQYKGNYKDLCVWLDHILLFEADRVKYQGKRPLESPAGFNWESAYGHFLKGKEFEQQRAYKQAFMEYQKSEEIEKWYVPSLTALSRLNYRKADYQAAMDYSLKALSVDTYDAGANMMYGVAGLALGDTASAIDGFSVATHDNGFRSSACNQLAAVFISKGDFKKGRDFAEKSLLYNSLSSDAVQLKIMCLRKLGLKDEAEKEMNILSAKDPLNHFVRFEKYIQNPSPENEELVKKYITNELPQETYLEYALWYYRNNQLSDALKVLNPASQDHSIVLLWQAYLNHLLARENAAKSKLIKALSAGCSFVLPFRAETLDALNWAGTLSDNWKIKYYQGLICLSSGATEKGRDLWKSCGREPDFYPFYLARCALMEADKSQGEADVLRALELSGGEWQAGWNAVRYYLGTGDKEKAEKLSRTYFSKYPGNLNIGFQYATVLEGNKKFTACINVLKNLQLLPGEGASESRTIWRNANLGEARLRIENGKYKKALEYIDSARLWPVNLGVGKPYTTDEMTEDSLALECYRKLKNEKAVKLMETKISRSTIKD